MIQTITIGNLTCECFNYDSLNICYILTPESIDAKQLADWAERYATRIVVISGMDWNNDLTPWSAPGIMRKGEAFGGNAQQFLTCLRTTVMPQVEKALGMPPSPVRTGIGISLSGLFLLWAWMQGNDFTNIGSISGSLWYDGFADWLTKTSKADKSGHAYFSLGDQEGKSKNQRFRTVETDTIRIVEALQREGIRTMFELTSGSHHSPIIPRIEKLFDGLTKLNDNK